MKRRQFIQISTTTLLGTYLFPSITLANKQANYFDHLDEDINHYIDSFVTRIGGVYTGYELDDFLKLHELQCTLGWNIRRENKKLRKHKYKVFGSVYRRKNTLLYTAHRKQKRQWDADTILLVYNRCNGELRTKLDEGAIVGLSKTAMKIFKESQSHKQVYDYITPFMNKQDFSGSLFNGYHQTLQYESHEAEVEVDIVDKGGGDRLIKIIGSKGYHRVFDEEFLVSIS